MSMKPTTHSAGFNVTSLKNQSGIYILYGEKAQILYVGSCEDKNHQIENWKKRFQAHLYYKGQKLTQDVCFMDVIIPDQGISHKHLLVLEYLLMWYLRPQKNLPKGLYTRWRYFYWKWDEETVKSVAKDTYGFEIRGTVSEFLKTLKHRRIKREREASGSYKKYGEADSGIIKVVCSGKRTCQCFNCLTNKRHRKINYYKNVN